MTTKTTKTVLFAALLSAIIIPASVMALDQKPLTPEAEISMIQAHVDELYSATTQLADKQTELDNLNKSETASVQEINTTKEQIAELEKIMDNKTTILVGIQEDLYERHTIEPALKAQLDEAEERAKILRTELDIPFVAIGTSSAEKALNLRIDVNALTSEKDEDYYTALLEKEFGDLPMLISFVEMGTEDSCTSYSGQNCDPIVGGIQMEAVGHGYCTIGIPVTRDSVEGYITSGHCVTLGSGTTDDVYQHTETAGTKVGDATVRIYDADCDCAFIDHSGSEDTQEKIWYSSNYYISVTSYVDRVADGTLVIMTGATSGPKSAVIDDGTDTWYFNSITWDVASTTTDVTSRGDGGAPWTSLAKSTFYGMHKGSDGSASYFIPWENVADATNGLDL